MIYIYFIALVIVFIAGYFTCWMITYDRGDVVGSMTINETDPTREFFTINFEKDLDEFKDNRYLVFKANKI